MTHLAGLPFAASFDALAFIVATIRTSHAASDHLPVDFGRLSEAAMADNRDLVPGLSVVFNSCSWDATGIREVIPYEHFVIGGHLPETISDYGFQEVDIWGWTLFVHPETLARLNRKQLVLRQEKQRQVLIAVKC